MLHIILGILTILLTILKWLGILLLVLLLLALTLLAIVLLAPAHYRGRAEKTEEKLEAQLSVTWLLRLLVVEAAIDAGGGRLEIRIFGRTLETWRALLKRQKQKRKKHRTEKSESPESSGKKRETAAKSEKCIQEENPVHVGQSQQIPVEKPKILEEKGGRPEEVKRQGSVKTLTDVADSEDKTEGVRKNSCAAEQIQKQPERLKKEEEQIQNEAGRFSKIMARIRGFLSGLPQKVAQIFRLPIIIADGGLKAAQCIRDAVPKLIEKIQHILHQPDAFLQFWEEYEVSEVLGVVKGELFTLLDHYRPQRFSGYLKFGTGDPAQTGELTGALYLLFPTQEYEILPNFEEAQFETETEFSGHIRNIHLLVTAYHLFRNKKLKWLIRKLRKKGE